MHELIFITYIIALVALAFAAYALLEIRELKKHEKRKHVQKRLQQITQNVTRPKGHWD